MFYILSTSEWLTVLIRTIDHTQKGIVRNLNMTSVPFLDPSIKNNTASIFKSTRVRTTPFKRNYPCACPINIST